MNLFFESWQLADDLIDKKSKKYFIPVRRLFSL